MKPRKRSPRALIQAFKRIRLVIMDSDGVLTDGRIIIGSDGTDYRSFYTHDGYGIVRARTKGLLLAVISGSTSRALERRLKALGIDDVYQGTMDKVRAFGLLKKKHHLDNEEVCFIGDDEFDLPLLSVVGVSAAPANAMVPVKRVVDYVTSRPGGEGAVRELLDLILKAQGNLI